MAFKKVEKYNVDDTLLYTFESVKECCELEKISEYIVRKYNSNNNTRNGIFYRIIDYAPKYIDITCEWCGKKVKRLRHSAERKHKHTFCTSKCHGEFIKSKRKHKICIICGKEYYSKNNNSKYCSQKCHYQDKREYMKGEKNHQYGLKGDKNATWKSDEKVSYFGYKLVRQLDHPFKNCDDFVFEHRLVAEKYLLNDENAVIVDGKKYLSPNFIAHHIDFDRTNNDKDNLIVMSLEEHASLHSKINHSHGELIEYCNKFNLDVDVIKKRSANSPKWHKK